MRATFVFIAIMGLTVRSALAEEQTAQQPKAHGPLTAENCNPQPDCRINYPSVLPGASPSIQILGGSNSIINNIIRDPVKCLTFQKKC